MSIFDSPDYDRKYKPIRLGSFEYPETNYYILGISPNTFHEDFYDEIHIKTFTESVSLNNLAWKIGNSIFIDFLSNNRLEVYVGEYAEECGSDGETAYTYCPSKQTALSGKTRPCN